MNDQPASRIETFKHTPPGTSGAAFMLTAIGPRRVKSPRSRRLRK